MTTTEILDTVTSLAAAGALVAPVLYLLERTHRRASLDNGGRVAHWLRAVDHDADARRLDADLRALPTPAPEPRGTSTTSAARHHGRRPVRVTPAR
ncbi:hypothetical protein G7075_00810 [Phycicoccus sp. HDW14]|uniref:hypothetical protein n=1 Tax=Phycicoccus sp. HDW14 TaxID=2714941 RepID=UPI00140C8E4B|nr:hypothetical protein [Phycicoccus sp. HDW14]QIM20018.1 hypothetical protein G7075_00810 [Phycicoccus sp. HDW14]